MADWTNLTTIFATYKLRRVTLVFTVINLPAPGGECCEFFFRKIRSYSDTQDAADLTDVDYQCGWKRWLPTAERTTMRISYKPILFAAQDEGVFDSAFSRVKNRYWDSSTSNLTHYGLMMVCNIPADTTVRIDGSYDLRFKGIKS